ncbi:MAG: redoxin domain-containing protein [Planctomycetota bacterium]|jgi:peroxiredoxin|nr:redoxin domain-containing protein [Planctomycetota bacterium]MDP6761969.1 redoxin domain-containing protein [Planctomycetota bacterium]MDP6989306.1 redoxin domain-containing protein [Planctomycetota bacterium]
MIRILPSSVVLSLAALTPIQGVGHNAPSFEAAGWVNHIGERPTLRSLRGRTVLLQFFRSTEPPAGANWRLLKKFHHEYADKGLVVLGVTDEDHEAVETTVAQQGLPFPCAVGSDARERYGVGANFHQVLIDPRGEIFWTGPTNGLWNGKLLKALKGAQRLGDLGPLSLHLEPAAASRLKKVVTDAAKGELAKALGKARQIAEDERVPAEDRDEARALTERIEGHLDDLSAQIEDHIARREMLPPRAVLELVAKQFKGAPRGLRAAERLTELETDELLAMEVAAAEVFERYRKLLWTRGPSKTLSRFQDLIERYPDSRAAEKARRVVALDF